jgi:hypothetical protein
MSNVRHTQKKEGEQRMYPKEYFLDRFKSDATEDLLHRYATADLSDEAREAIHSLLAARGIEGQALQPLMLQARKAVYRKRNGTKECDFCGSSARFSAILDEGQRFCSKSCLRNARLLEVAEDISAEEIQGHAWRIKNSPCPECQQSSSKTEVPKYYRVWSAIVLTEWTKRTHICCHSCARKTNFGSLVFCSLFGWWGVPWGVIITPAQIVANISEMLSPKADPAPSEELLQAAKLQLAAKLYKRRALEANA